MSSYVLEKEKLYKRLVRETGDSRVATAIELAQLVRAGPAQATWAERRPVVDRMMKFEQELNGALLDLEHFTRRPCIHNLMTSPTAASATPLRLRNRDRIRLGLAPLNADMTCRRTEQDIDIMNRRELEALSRECGVPLPQGVLSTSEMRRYLQTSLNH